MSERLIEDIKTRLCEEINFNHDGFRSLNSVLNEFIDTRTDSKELRKESDEALEG